MNIFSHSDKYVIDDEVIKVKANFITNKIFIDNVSTGEKLFEDSLDIYTKFYGNMESFAQKVVELKNEDMGQTRIAMEIKKINRK